MKFMDFKYYQSVHKHTISQGTSSSFVHPIRTLALQCPHKSYFLDFLAPFFFFAAPFFFEAVFFLDPTFFAALFFFDEAVCFLAIAFFLPPFAAFFLDPDFF